MESKDQAINFLNVSKLYRRGPLYGTARDALAGLASRALRWSRDGAKPSEELRALRDVSFPVNRGEALGIIGPNGAGKTTILRPAAGITRPLQMYSVPLLHYEKTEESFFLRLYSSIGSATRPRGPSGEGIIG